MKEIIFILIGVACLISIIQSQPVYDKILDKLNLNFKPFSCPLCMTYWISFSILMVKGYYLESAFISAIMAVISEFIFRKLNNIL